MAPTTKTTESVAMETTSSTNVPPQVAKTTSSSHQQGEPSSGESLVATNMKYNMKKKMLEKYNNESRSVAIVAPMVMHQQQVAKQPEPSGDVCGDDVTTEMMSDDSCEGEAVAREAEKKGKKRSRKPQQSLQQVGRNRSFK